jgi:enoyl-CoA hydratase/carnithine racemase
LSLDPAADGPPSLHIDAAGVATVRLCRPAQRNALHDADLHALLRLFATLDADESVRVVVLRADTTGHRRPVFSAGYHVGHFEDEQPGPLLFEQVPDALARLRPITVCALNGSVYGGATDIVLACDLRIALAGCEWRMPAAALGLHYYPSGLRRYVQALGPAWTKRLFLTARATPLEQLAATGLFDSVLAPEQFDAGVRTLVDEVLQLGPLAAQLTKQSIGEIAAGEAVPARLREREARTAASADFAEARAAFAAKRKPVFTGR